MNEVNKTLFIPLYGKSQVSKQKIILNDSDAERIWEAEQFPIKGKSRSKWLAYNMAMRARVFDDWTEKKLTQNANALVLHIGCGLDSRYRRVKTHYTDWIDCDFADVISARKKYYSETLNYHMAVLDASKAEQIKDLPQSDTAIVILEGISMYLTKEQIHALFCALEQKYSKVYCLMNVYTEFGAKASKYKNPVNDVGVTELYGIDDIKSVLEGLKIHLESELSLIPENLINELKPLDRLVFKTLFSEKIYRKIYRLYELES